MLTREQRIPFSLDDLYSGLAVVDGILTIHSDELVFEFQTKDSVFGVVKSKPREIHIQMKEIVSIRYRKTWFVSRLYIHVSKLSYLQDFPKSEQGELVLKIKRKYKDTAKDIVSYVNYRLSEFRLDSMDSEFRSNEDW